MLPRISQVEGKEANFLLFSTEDFISNNIFRFGEWENHLTYISKFFLSGIENPIVLDIGANLGAYSIPMAKAIEASGGTVYAFEPQRIVYYQLCANTIINRLENHHALHVAVGEIESIIELPEVDYNKNHNVGAFSLEKKYRELHGIEAAMKNSKSKVPLITLNNFETNSKVSLIKVDVEGHEINVIRGAREFLSKNNYPPILFEAWNFEWFSEGRNELISALDEIGYESTQIGESDYIAQHHAHENLVEFEAASDGSIKMSRIK